MNGPEKTGDTLVGRFALPPAEIERRSLGLVTAALAGQFATDEERAVAARIVYSAGDLGLGPLIKFSAHAVEAGVSALQAGCRIAADVRMVITGFDRIRLGQLGCEVDCAIDHPLVASRARQSGLPRAVEAMRLLGSTLDGAVVVIGNAPTALLALLDLIDAGTVQPALIIGVPVGFIAAAESKQALCQRRTPYVTIEGTRGGSPLAAGALNALARQATARQRSSS